MDERIIEIGRVVCSKAGRDKKRYFIIRQVVDSQYVLIVDGELRKLASPKRKKIKHLQCMPDVARGLAEKFEQDKKVFDAEVRSWLFGAGYSQQED